MKSKLEGKNIILGVTGSIATYKACEITRLLACEGANVNVVMTQGATKFVTPMTFQALSKNTVRHDIWNLTDESNMSHIELADNADMILIAPASADIIAKAACGICDDLLTTILVVTRAQLVIAPAMNVHMYEHPTVVENIAKLKKRGAKFIGPAKGSLACGYEGLGRLEDPEKIVSYIMKSPLL